MQHNATAVLDIGTVSGHKVKNSISKFQGMGDAAKNMRATIPFKYVTAQERASNVSNLGRHPPRVFFASPEHHPAAAASSSQGHHPPAGQPASSLGHRQVGQSSSSPGHHQRQEQHASSLGRHR
jgi:hypothetical protein